MAFLVALFTLFMTSTTASARYSYGYKSCIVSKHRYARDAFFGRMEDDFRQEEDDFRQEEDEFNVDGGPTLSRIISDVHSEIASSPQ
eukprot:gene8862-16478_t